MARKRYTAEQIIGYLRQAEVLLGQSQARRTDLASGGTQGSIKA